MYPLIRPLLFKLPPESAHCVAMQALECRLKLEGASPPPARATKTCMGLRFANPIGLAAGFDKNAANVDALATLEFGFIEVGGVTPRPQPGNPAPRIFRLPESGALINRMGFNNIGAAGVAANLRKSGYRARGGVIGVNIGKNADTPDEKTADDYVSCLEALYTLGDFFTLNVSSPNTKNLRDWQTGDRLRHLLQQVIAKRDELAEQHGSRSPLAVKIAPDMSDDEITAFAEVINDSAIDGVVATNTTTARPSDVAAHPAAAESGGLSGKPLAARATAVIKLLRATLADNIAIIGVGGIDSPAAANEKFAAGADLAQLYTGLIYHGAALPGDIIRSL